MTDHKWVKSNLGHGETMCEKCKVTNREAAVLGLLNTCDVPDADPATSPYGIITDEIDAYTDEDREQCAHIAERILESITANGYEIVKSRQPK
jgi:hypothetical protein